MSLGLKQKQDWFQGKSIDNTLIWGDRMEKAQMYLVELATINNYIYICMYVCVCACVVILDEIWVHPWNICIFS